jgi:hypothetical protein
LLRSETFLDAAQADARQVRQPGEAGQRDRAQPIALAVAAALRSA